SGRADGVRSSNPPRARLPLKGEADALEERPPDAPQRVVDALRRAAALTRDVRDARAFAVARLQQFAVALPQFFHAAAQGVAPPFQFVVGQFGLCLDEHQIEFVAEIEFLPAAGAEEVGDLKAGDAAGPGEETALRVELGELLPQDDGG